MSTMNAINLEHNHEQDVKRLKDSNCDLKSDDLTYRPSKIRTELHKSADKLIGSGGVRSIAQSLYP